jgi:hypothetical protein
MASKIKLVTGDTFEVDQSRDEIAGLLADGAPTVTVSHLGTHRDIISAALVYVEDVPVVEVVPVEDVPEVELVPDSSA